MRFESFLTEIDDVTEFTESMDELQKEHKKQYKLINTQLKFLRDDMKNSPQNVRGRLESLEIAVSNWRQAIKGILIEGYKDNPRDLRAMKKSGTRGTGVNPNDLYTTQADRKSKVGKLKFINFSKKDLNSSALKSAGKYAQKLGIKVSFHNSTLEDWQDEGRNPDGGMMGYAVYMKLEIDGREEQIYVENNYEYDVVSLF